MRKASFIKIDMTSDNDIYQGESIEEYVRRSTTTKQPIDGSAPIIYTARKDGVMEAYNIRTDRFALAQKAMDKVAGSYQAKRQEWIKSQEPTQETQKESA